MAILFLKKIHRTHRPAAIYNKCYITPPSVIKNLSSIVI